MQEIKAIRKNKGWTQKTFAEYLGIPTITYVQWENGKRSAPSYVLNLIKYKLKNDTNQIKLQKKYLNVLTLDKEKKVRRAYPAASLEEAERIIENEKPYLYKDWTTIITETDIDIL